MRLVRRSVVETLIMIIVSSFPKSQQHRFGTTPEKLIQLTAHKCASSIPRKGLPIRTMDEHTNTPSPLTSVGLSSPRGASYFPSSADAQSITNVLVPPWASLAACTTRRILACEYLGNGHQCNGLMETNPCRPRQRRGWPLFRAPRTVTVKLPLAS